MPFTQEALVRVAVFEFVSVRCLGAYLQRDIPMPLVTSGIERGNLREVALARMGQLGLRCRDVRTREVGIQDIHHCVRPDEVELIRRDYTANGGWEVSYTHAPVQGNSTAEYPVMH